VEKHAYPNIADWLVITLRWLALAGAAASLSINNGLDWSTGSVLIFASVWNLISMLVTSLNKRFRFYMHTHVLVDFLTSMLLYGLTTRLGEPLTWAGVLVIFSAASYFEWRGGLLAAGAISILQIVLSRANLGSYMPSQALLILSVFNIFTGVLLGIMARNLLGGLRQNFMQFVDKDRPVRRYDRGRLKAIYTMVETLSATLNHQVVLDTALNISISALGEKPGQSGTIVSAALLFDDRDMKISTARGLTPRDLRVTFAGTNGVLKAVLESSEPILISDPANDPELNQLVALHKCKSVFLLPLRRAQDVFGVLLFAHPDIKFFSPDHQELLEVVSNQAVIAIQNARLFRDIQKENERMLEMQEEARKKLARDLHDGPTQSVASIAMRINIARKMLSMNSEDTAEELVRIEELARNTIKEIRHMLFTLRPLVLESEGLVAALQTMAEKMHDTYQQNVSIKIDPKVLDSLDLTKQTVVFFLVEEALNNARKYAQANKIEVRLYCLPKDKEIAILDVGDNGIGFDVNAVNNNYERRGSLGMVNLRERTELIDGQLYIDSTPGKGTHVYVRIPLTEEAIDRIQRGIT
jgi:signal transduction histidine kinase